MICKDRYFHRHGRFWPGWRSGYQFDGGQSVEDLLDGEWSCSQCNGVVGSMRSTGRDSTSRRWQPVNLALAALQPGLSKPQRRGPLPSASPHRRATLSERVGERRWRDGADRRTTIRRANHGRLTLDHAGAPRGLRATCCSTAGLGVARLSNHHQLGQLRRSSGRLDWFGHAPPPRWPVHENGHCCWSWPRWMMLMVARASTVHPLSLRSLHRHGCSQ